MEGRWAQLTIDAHIAKAIDYSRPIKPFIEAAILRRIELQRDFLASQLYPVVNDEGKQLDRTEGWATQLYQRFKPWAGPETENEEQATLLDKIAYLEERRKQNG